LSTPLAGAATIPGDGGVIARVQQVAKRYPGVLALDNVDFDIRAGEVRALLGKNGAGKSTLIRMLTGASEPDTGDVFIAGHRLSQPGQSRTAEAAQHGVRAVYQELSQVPGMSVAENLFLGRWLRGRSALSFPAMERETAAILAKLGVDLDPRARVGSLSPAQRQLAEIARVFLGEPKLVILDEPTSSLAAAEVELLFRAVRTLVEAGIAVIYVSHRMEEIRQIASTATVMRDGRVAGTVNVTETSTAEIVRLMLGHEDRQDAEISVNRTSSTTPVVLEARHIRLPPKLVDVGLQLRKGEVLGIAGLLGTGRTELLHVLAGLETPLSGDVLLDGKSLGRSSFESRVRHGIAYTPESRKEDGVIPELGVDENIVCTNFEKVSSGWLLSWARIAQATRNIVERLNIRAAFSSTRLATLSGGNQQKVVIGRWVHAGSRILLLDEATRGVDIEAKQQIYAIIRTLAQEGKSVIFVSSEIEELSKVCDRVLVLRAGRIVESFEAPLINAETLMASCISSS
jgi:simple sugar transport system ATP-binding protein